MTSIKRGRPLKSQAREIVYNVHQFMENEAQSAKNRVFSKEDFQIVMERTAQATGISRKTVSNILNEKESSEAGASISTGTTFRTPKKGRYKKTHRTTLDDFDYQIIRRKVYDFHTVENQVPTVKSLLNVLKRDISFTVGRETLRKILRELGFRFKKAESNRKILAEKDEVRLLRIKYLTLIKQYRNEGRNIVYGDESYVHTTHTKESAWADKTGKGLKKPISKGQRLIIVHAGGSNGFVPGALLIYKSSQSTGDYHNEMNTENYEKLLKNQLIPNLPPRSVFVIDNAAYHNTIREKAPNSNSRKGEMQQWLSSKNIPYDVRAFKPELYDIIKRHKKDYIQYSIDTIMEEHGHKVLRLPPYHPDFNPIENIWSQVKGHVSQHNVKMNFTEVTKLLNEKFSSIDVEAWRRVVDHAIKCEDEFLTIEEALDIRLDQFVINTESSSSSSDNSEEHEENTTTDSEIEGIVPLD